MATLPQGIEVRQDLSSGQDVLAFGLSEARADDVAVMNILAGALIDYVNEHTEKCPTRLVIVDLRNVGPITATALGKLIVLNQRLSRVSWRLLLVVDDPVMREVFVTTHLDKFFKVASSAELGPFTNQNASRPVSPDGDRLIEFTEQELAEMISSGITLDDAIREIEQLRR